MNELSLFQQLNIWTIQRIKARRDSNYSYTEDTKRLEQLSEDELDQELDSLQPVYKTLKQQSDEAARELARKPTL